MDPNDTRFRAQHSPRSDATTMNAFVSPPRNRLSQTFQQQQQQQQQQQSQPQPQPQAVQDPRSNLSRRFTTDSGRVPTLSANIAGPRGPEEYQAMQQLQLIEKKRLEFERIREQKRLFEAEMQKHEMELSQMVEEHGRLSGHQSEPTTPPEYRETSTGFPGAFSRPNANRYSLSSLQSPPGMVNRSARSGSILASPQSGVPLSRFAFDDQLPSWSQQTSRRNSDEDEKEEAVRQDPTSHRATNAVNRYSMPVTKSRTAFYDIENLDQAGTTGFLFRDDDSAPEAKLYTQTTTEDNFPTLIRQSTMSTSGSDAASIAAHPANYRHSLEMMEQQQKYSDTASDTPASTNNGSVLATPPKLQPSFSANDIPTLKQVSGSGVGITPNHAAQQHLHNHNASMGRIPAGALRHSRELSADGRDNNNNNSNNATASYQSLGSTLHANATPFITPTQGLTQAPVLNQGPQIPVTTAIGNNQGGTPFNTGYYNTPSSYTSNGFGNTTNGYASTPGGYSSTGSAGLGGPAGYAGPATNLNSGSSGGMNGGLVGSLSGGFSGGQIMGQNMGQNGGQHGLPLVSALSNLSLNGGNGYSPANNSLNGGGNGYLPTNNGLNGGGNGYLPTNNSLNGGGNGYLPASNHSPANHLGYSAVYAAQQPRDSQARIMQNRRQQDLEGMAPYNGQPLEAFGGQIYQLCKDQHGCRYLQKQLESRDPEVIKKIWLETCSHVVELMTDPFGNYLCQKLLEACNDDQRTVLVQNASKDMVRVALNQHGTRALQKMIENLSNREQVELVIQALRERVVDLIQDLNGNHVIQKCLNKLKSADAQFIFNAVGEACIDVGTHRHGCCVLQRCIDHAEGADKAKLIRAITQHALVLVQDPFGNYVIQYIIDINEPDFTNPIVGRFLNDVVELSRHKFSSNVIEKCLRCASDEYKDMIVDSLLVSGMMNDLVRDQFGNYVIQTSLDHATKPMKRRLVDAIRPNLSNIRSTPFGRKMQHKINMYDSGSPLLAGRTPNTQQTSLDVTQGQPAHRGGDSRRMSNDTLNRSPAYTNGNRSGQDFQQSSEVTLPALQRVPQAQGFVPPHRAQQNENFVSPQRPQQTQGYNSTSQLVQNPGYNATPQHTQGYNPPPPQRPQQTQGYTPSPQRAQQNQGYLRTPQRAQQSQGYVPPQPLNRFGGSPYARGNGSPGANGILGNGVSRGGFDAPNACENGEQNFF